MLSPSRSSRSSRSRQRRFDRGCPRPRPPSRGGASLLNTRRTPAGHFAAASDSSPQPAIGFIANEIPSRAFLPRGTETEEKRIMRKLAFGLAAAAALGVAVPASAQGLYVGVGEGGFGIGVMDDYGAYYGWDGSYRHHYRHPGGYAYYGSPHYYSPGYAYGYGPGYAYG